MLKIVVRKFIFNYTKPKQMFNSFPEIFVEASLVRLELRLKVSYYHCRRCMQVNYRDLIRQQTKLLSLRMKQTI